jgi:hypothetical protein
LNKFKRPNEYPEVKQGPSLIEKMAPQEQPKVGEWECIGCADKAVLLHRGTAYCRRCYDKRNYDGSLIG